MTALSATVARRVGEGMAVALSSRRNNATVVERAANSLKFNQFGATETAHCCVPPLAHATSMAYEARLVLHGSVASYSCEPLLRDTSRLLKNPVFLKPARDTLKEHWLW